MATRYNYTGNIVTQGLVLNLDAAKTDSYPGTGTTWRDLSGFNNNGTLINGPTFSGPGKQASIVFDGVNDECNLGNILFTSSIANNCTFDIWLYNLENRNSRYYLSKGSFASGLGGITFGLTSTISQRIRFQMESATSVRSPYVEFITPTGSWYNLTYTYDGTTIRGYQNSTTSNLYTSSLAGPLLNISSPIKLGNDTFSGYANCYISNFKIYNRTLSQAEITQNFNALRGRYGI
jgi:hypothetical protein